MKGPFAAKAIFTAARIMGERAGNRDGARAMYEFLVKSFPADDLAVRAKEALKRL
jgi:TolA-binding protein